MERTPDVELRSQAPSRAGRWRMGRRAPPFMRWDQRGKPELQLSVKQLDGTTVRVMIAQRCFGRLSFVRTVTVQRTALQKAGCTG